MPPLPSTPTPLLPKGGVIILTVKGIATNLHQPKARVGIVRKSRLILSIGQAVARNPGRPAALLPDGGKALIAILRIATDPQGTIARSDEIVDRLLILCVGQAMPHLQR